MSAMATRKGRRVAITAGAVALVVIALAVVLGWPHLVSWYRFARAFEALGRNAQGYQEYRHRQTGIVMVKLPGGKYWMGAQETDPNGQNYAPQAWDDEGPVHEVTLSPFLIAKYEVTSAQWNAVMGSRIVIRGELGRFLRRDNDWPMASISWDDVQQFNAKTGLRLPTEAQWEYACRGGTTTPIAGTGKLDEMGWYGENSGDTPHPVGKKAPSTFGLHDMQGNVWEWCEDVYDEAFYGKPEVDPVSASGSGDRVVRGGSWAVGANACRSAFRGRVLPATQAYDLGFRAALVSVP